MTLTLRELLRSAETSAFHLEMRDGYMRSAPEFIAWQAGDRQDPDDRSSWWRPWLDLMMETVGRGVDVHRARIVSEPISEYIWWEYSITYQNLAAGERVRWLPRHSASELALPGNDFWLIDNRTVLWNHFTGEGEVSSDDKEISADPATVGLCVRAFNAAWERGIDHEEYKPK